VGRPARARRSPRGPHRRAAALRRARAGGLGGGAAPGGRGAARRPRRRRGAAGAGGRSLQRLAAHVLRPVRVQVVRPVRPAARGARRGRGAREPADRRLDLPPRAQARRPPRSGRGRCRRRDAGRRPVPRGGPQAPPVGVRRGARAPRGRRGQAGALADLAAAAAREPPHAGAPGAVGGLHRPRRARRAPRARVHGDVARPYGQGQGRPHRRRAAGRGGEGRAHRLQARVLGAPRREGGERESHARRPAPPLRRGGGARAVPRRAGRGGALPLRAKRQGQQGGGAREPRRRRPRRARRPVPGGPGEGRVPGRPRRRPGGLRLLPVRRRRPAGPPPLPQGPGARRRAGGGGGGVSRSTLATPAGAAPVDELTPEQRRAASAPGSVAVVAGAGTGKTKMLAHRYLHHLESGLSPLEVVAVTFTEKAAAELRSRIRALVRSERPRDRLTLVELEAAQISTVHALAARVCRDHPEEAEVAPDFGVLDEVEGVLWREERLEEAIASLPQEVVDAVPVYLLRAVLRALVEDPLTAEPALSRGPDDWRALLAEAHETAYARIAAAPEWRGWRETLRAHVGADGDRAEEHRRACLEALEALEAREPERALALAKTVKLNAGSQRNWEPGALGAVKDAMRAVRDAIVD